MKGNISRQTNSFTPIPSTNMVLETMNNQRKNSEVRIKSSKEKPSAYYEQIKTNKQKPG